MEVHLPAPAAHEPGPVTSTVWLVTAKNALTDIGRRVKSLCEPYTWCAIFVSLGGAAWGYDTGSIGPVTVMPQFEAHFQHLSPTKQGIVVSSILLTGSLFSVIAGPLADRISRTRLISLGALVFAAGEGLCVGAQRGQLAAFIAGRCLAGAGEGLFLSTITTYICEIAPTSRRGRINAIVQLSITVGVAAGYFTCYGSVGLDNDWAWRAPYVFQVVLGCVLASGALALPHSPRWLKHVGRLSEVEAGWARLGVSLAEAEKEEEADARSEQMQQGRGKSLKETWLSLWRKDVRSRTILAVFLNGMNQASGIDAVLFYAPVVFVQAGLSSTTSSFLASGLTGIVNLVVTIPTVMYGDKWGRRPSTISGGLGIACTMLLIGTLYASRANDAEAGRIAIIVLIFLFLISYATTWGGVIRIYVSEIQPMHTRAATTALSQAANWIVNFIVAFSTPAFLEKSSSGPYFLFGGCSLAVVVVCFFFQAESRGVSLEELNRAFDGSQWDSSLHRLCPCIRAHDAIELHEVRAPTPRGQSADADGR